MFTPNLSSPTLLQGSVQLVVFKKSLRKLSAHTKFAC